MSRLRAVAGDTLGALDRLVPHPSGITVLAYHRVGGATPVSVDLPVAVVADHFAMLSATSEVIGLDEAVERLTGGGQAPAVVLTADDGTADWVDTLLPLLVEHGLPMTWYVATRFVEDQVEFPNGGRPTTWAALRDALATGLVTVGSHTHSHLVTAGLDARTAADDLDRSIGLVEDRLGVACRHFAHPKAMAPSADADREVRRRFRSAALAGNRVNVPGRTDPGRLGRTPLQRRDQGRRFQHLAAGGGRLEGWVRERFDRVRHRDAVT